MILQILNPLGRTSKCISLRQHHQSSLNYSGKVLVVILLGLFVLVPEKSIANATSKDSTLVRPTGTTEGNYALHIKIPNYGDGATLKGATLNHTITAGHVYSFRASIFIVSIGSPLEVWFSLSPYRSSYNEISAWFYNASYSNPYRFVSFAAGQGTYEYAGWKPGIWYNLEIRLKDDSGGFFINGTQVSPFSNANTLGLQIRDLYSLGLGGLGEFYADDISVVEDNSILFFEGFENGLANLQVSRFSPIVGDSGSAIVDTAYFGPGIGKVSSIISLLPGPEASGQCVQVLDLCLPPPFAYTVSLGSKLQLDGTILNADTLEGIDSATVTLSTSDPSGQTFVTIGSFKTSSSGMLSVEWTPSRMGLTILRATYSGNNSVFASSSTVYIGVGKAFGKILVSLSSSTSLLGFSVQISGSLKSWNSVPVRDQNILFAFTVPGASDWTAISSAMTKADGSYQLGWIPRATGTFVVRASWAGDDIHQFTQTTVSLASILEGQSVLSVSSDFSLSSLSYDNSSRALTFTIRGMRGAEGTTEIALPRSLVSDVAGIQVLLNATKMETRSVVTNDAVRTRFSVVLYASYDARVTLGSSSAGLTDFASFYPPPVILLLFGALAVGSFIAFAGFRRRRTRFP